MILISSDSSFIEKYLKIIGFPEALDYKEENYLLTKYRLSGDNKYLRKIILRSQYIVIKEVLAFYGKGIGLSDLIQYANLYCIEAVQSYTDSNNSLKQYMHYYIYNRLNNLPVIVSSEFRYPLNVIGQLNNYAKTISKNTDINNSNIPDVAKQLYYNEKYFVNKIYSIEEYPDLLYCDDNNFEDLRRISLKKEVEKQLQTLTVIEREVIKMYYGLNEGYPMTLNDIGQILNLTRERVRQINVQAIDKLKHVSRSKYLKGYFNDINNLNYDQLPNLDNSLFEEDLEQEEIIELLRNYIKPRTRESTYRNTKLIDVKIEEPKVHFVDLCKKINIPLKSEEVYLLNQFEKEKGVISKVRLESISKIRKIDFNAIIFNINMKFRNKYSRELIKFDNILVLWECDKYFNNLKNWEGEDVRHN